MNTRLRIVLLATSLAAVAACASPVAPNGASADTSPQLTTASDSSAARGGGNLMGGN